MKLFRLRQEIRLNNRKIVSVNFLMFHFFDFYMAVPLDKIDNFYFFLEKTLPKLHIFTFNLNMFC